MRYLTTCPSTHLSAPSKGLCGTFAWGVGCNLYICPCTHLSAPSRDSSARSRMKSTKPENSARRSLGPATHCAKVCRCGIYRGFKIRCGIYRGFKIRFCNSSCHSLTMIVLHRALCTEGLNRGSHGQMGFSLYCVA